MCAEYKVSSTVVQIRKQLNASVTNHSTNSEWNLRVKMTLRAPVLQMNSGEIELVEMVFPANPFPNARLSQLNSNKSGNEVAPDDDGVTRIDQIPLWKTGFNKFPCVVPMTSFLEPAYWGTQAGKVVEFSDPENEVLFVPSILIRPRVPPTSILNGFSLLTHTASDQMLHYHHRLLMFLRPHKAASYLKLGSEISSDERIEFLLENRHVPQFKTSIDREMANGWRSRVEKHEAALRSEQRYSAALQREGIKS